MCCIVLQFCRRDYIVGVFVFWQWFNRLFAQLCHSFVYCFAQLWRRLSDNISAERCDERCAHNCPVFVLNICITNNMIAAHQCFSPAKRSQRWSEQKELNTPIKIKFNNFWYYRKWRIIEYDATVGIIKCFVISVGVKRAHNACGGYAIFLASPIPHNGINFWRSIAIIRCFLCFEFINKFLILQIFVCNIKQRSLFFVHSIVPFCNKKPCV